jgi:hypothetical protein
MSELEETMLSENNLMIDLIKKYGRIAIYRSKGSYYLSVRIPVKNDSKAARYLKWWEMVSGTGNLQEINKQCIYIVTGKGAERLMQAIDLALIDSSNGTFDNVLIPVNRYIDLMERRRKGIPVNKEDIEDVAEELSQTMGTNHKRDVDLVELMKKPLPEEFKDLAQELRGERDKGNK